MTPQPNDPALNERAQHLLRALVQSYIRDGEPVGSRTLARDAGLDLSPASIRNVMADLESLGLVSSPHTSAGRVPTARGYRVFVDSLLVIKPVDNDALRHAQRTLAHEGAPPSVLAGAASNLLAELTHLAGVVTTPRRAPAAWRQIEFLALGEDRVLAILVFQDGEVQNKVLQLERRVAPESLARASQFLNERFAGRDLVSVRAELLGEMQQARASMDQMMRDAIGMAERMFATGAPATPAAGVMVTGEKHLIDFAELSNIDTLRRLFEAFEQKREILGLLDKCVAAEGVQIFIGEESGYRALDECSVVTAPYSVDGEMIGVLGVIGPTRMAYDRVIPIVDLTARLMSAALSQRR